MQLDNAGALYIGGDFTTVDNQPRRNAARVSVTTGQVDPDWNPSPSGSVRGFAFDPQGNVVVVGDFLSADSQNHAFLARLNRVTGAADPNWNTHANGGVGSVVIGANGAVYAGGHLTFLGGQPRSRIAKLSPGVTAVADPDWNPGSNGIVRALQRGPADSLFVGGQFTRTNALAGASRSGVAALPRTSADGVFADPFE